MEGCLVLARQFCDAENIEIAEEQRGCEEKETCCPDRGRSAEKWQKMLCRDRLDRKKQESAQKNSACKERVARTLFFIGSISGHA